MFEHENISVHFDSHLGRNIPFNAAISNLTMPKQSTKPQKGVQSPMVSFVELGLTLDVANHILGVSLISMPSQRIKALHDSSN